ncbi:MULTISPECIES: thiaminase II [Achromobacter]|jgi:thiaminase (transcriptional activator TenA)|uniref:thiaminase II n=1 Tax=Achromobacter TaxID=222 RepID=UPI000CFA95D2|nr:MULTISPECIES: thiaminase II [Achromobacter]MBB1598273.1 thiaminase II [Achromobacter sp. UMC46]MDR6604556.1 thiaminase/transcriptional activator TenA [Achromobacter deleyi]PQZ71088.1 thiaminase II [Achromobacter sp. MYb9]HCW16493.1 thiaminase II [Achromobacter sp.]
MSFSSDAWARNAALYEKTRDMPFNRELASGQLDENAFKHYMIQDAHYLVAFGRALAIAAAKADDADGVVQFADAAKGAVVAERSLHAGFMKQFGIDAATFEATPLTPASHHYTSFLIATAWSAPYPVALAALLPCFWIYAEIGREIHAHAARPNPYAAWIDTYAGDDFHALVRAVIASVDRAAETASAHTREAMHQAYTHAAQLEWMFWDSAHRQAGWPV